MFRRGVMGYLPVNLAQAVAGFGAVVVFTRVLSPADYGAYALGSAAAALVYTCLFTWIEAAMARFWVAEAQGPARATLYGTLYRTFAVASLGLPLLFAAAVGLAPVSPAVRGAVAAGLGSIVVRSLLKLAQERRRAAGEVTGFAVYDIAQTLGGFGCGVAFARLGLGGAGPLLGLTAASAACLAFALPAELAAARAGRFDGTALRRYAAYGLPVSLSLVMSLALASTDRFVLAAYLNPAAVGAYHAGYSLSSRTLDVIFIWLGMAGGPAAVAALERGGRPALERVARSQAQLMALVALPAATGLALVARPLAEVMVGPGLREAAARVTPWIAAGGLMSGAATYYFHTAFTLSRRTPRLILAVALPALANLALALWLIPRHGLDGAMWATTASYALSLLVAVALGRTVLPLPIPWRALGVAASACGLMAAVVTRLPAVGGLAELASKAALGAVVYALAVLALDAPGVRTELAGRLRALRERPA